MTMVDHILILDFGSQTTQLIARRIREAGVYSEIHPYNFSIEKIRDFAPKGIILSGSPARIVDSDSPAVSDELFQLNIPMMSMCYGMQEIARRLGGRVGAVKREYGYALTHFDSESSLFAGIGTNPDQTWMSHNDVVVEVPAGFVISAWTDSCPVAAMEHREKRIYGTQFHPEVTHTILGQKLINNFVFNICGCQPGWSMKSFIGQEMERIQQQVGNQHVILGLSGGVDSSVTAALLQKAIGDQLTCIFVNNGLLRKNEHLKIPTLFKEKMGMDVVVADAEAQMLVRLKGVVDPEKKRKIIGHEFITIFEQTAKKLEKEGKKPAAFLAQGTLYPDVIESVSFKGPACTIKSHHNVGGLPEKMSLKLVEPLRELFKDEVRLLGRELGMPAEILQRQPFPGPGLAVRVIGEITRERLDLLREADDVMMREVKAAGWYNKVWQSFCVLLPIQTVGVMGDERTYENVVALRVVESQDGMSANWVQLPHELLGKISNAIINEVKGVNRVVYDISSKPPATIEWE